MDSQKTISQEGGGVRDEKDGKYFGSYVVYVSWLGSYAVVQRGELEQHWMISCMDSRKK